MCIMMCMSSRTVLDAKKTGSLGSYYAMDKCLCNSEKISLGSCCINSRYTVHVRSRIGP